MISATAALQRLRTGNQRFVVETSSQRASTSSSRRTELVAGQEPFAIILGCSDSRVPAEIVFGQGLGDLFVIRVAGNIVAPSQIGSIEFAVEVFRTPVVVVMGHTMCGAVSSTLDQLERPTASRSPNLRSIVDRIEPAVEPLLETELRHDRTKLLAHAIRANIRAATNQVRRGSRILESLIQNNELLVVGAEYSLETGVVDFFDEPTG
ncbi:MAG: carbonic anhydrase [Pseudomonadales bacterium]|nr:carbonic anhydrase [Pseudomonadales bacterium]